MSFHVGQKVVCVSAPDCDGGRGDERFPTNLLVGEIYNIRWIGIYNESLTVRLVGLYRNAPKPEWIDTPFLASRFRPVIERKTDISVFTALLDPANHKHLEDVR